MATGEARLSLRDGRVAEDCEAVEMLRESLGLTAREASILTDDELLSCRCCSSSLILGVLEADRGTVQYSCMTDGKVQVE